MNEEKLDGIILRLDALLGLSLSNLEEASQKEKLLYFYHLGFLPSEIARILGTSPNSVRAAISKARRRQ